MDVLEDIALRRRVRQLASTNQGLFPQGLHRVQFPRALKTDQHDLAKATLAQHLGQERREGGRERGRGGGRVNNNKRLASCPERAWESHSR